MFKSSNTFLFKYLRLNRLFRGYRTEIGPIILNRQRIYIIPSNSGWVLVMLLFAMLLGAINYNNSLTYALIFLLVSVMLISMLHTWRNLYNLQLSLGKCIPVHAGNLIEVPISINNPDEQARFALKLRWSEKKPLEIDLGPYEQQWVKFNIPAFQRGYQPLQKIVLYSRFPLGLFHAWSNLYFDQQCLVYPRLADERRLPQNISQHGGDSGAKNQGADDFVGLRKYQDGDSLRHIDWKALARQRGLFVRQFGGNQDDELILSWDQINLPDVEQRISQLTRWVIEADQAGLRYGLQLPNVQLPINHGNIHRNQCLTTLAIYGKTS